MSLNAHLINTSMKQQLHVNNVRLNAYLVSLQLTVPLVLILIFSRMRPVIIQAALNIVSSARISNVLFVIILILFLMVSVLNLAQLTTIMISPTVINAWIIACSALIQLFVINAIMGSDILINRWNVLQPDILNTET